MILPPGSSSVVVEYFVRKTVHPWRWIALGLGGTLIAGTQVMVGYMEGFRVIEGDLIQPGYVTAPVAGPASLVRYDCADDCCNDFHRFREQVRTWRFFQPGSPHLTREIDVGLLRIRGIRARHGCLGFTVPAWSPGACELPGPSSRGIVSTVLWWVTDLSFGCYVRKMPYDVIYRGLASAIGLLLWMFLTAVIVLLGAAYNAEMREAAAPNKLLVIVP